MTPRGGWRRWRTPAGVAAAVIAIAVAAAFANVALLGSTGEERLGRLRPVDSALTTPRDTTTGDGETVIAPATTTAPTGGTTSTDDSASPGDDSGRGRGRGRGGDDDGDDD